ncbi:MAG: hypothetical protein HY081_05985 [Gammaproteobacteria bacterium]|nr:hypothetical protein [Gammaproteobacteria bacterium]
MTTPDPKYKHKPSEKHTLEEVLKSLQDLIRNDLVEGKPSPSEQTSADVSDVPNTSAALNQQAIQSESLASLHEDFSPTTPQAGPVNFEAVMQSLQNLITNELAIGETSSTASAETTPAADAVEPLAEVPPAPATETISEDLISLDDALTLDDALEIEPPLTDSVTADSLEFPGEISLDLLSEPEPEPPAAAIATETAIEDIPPPIEPPMPASANVEVVQQKLILDEAPVLLAQKLEPLVQQSESLPAASAPEIIDDSTEINFEEPIETPTQMEGPADETLPTIEVDESFDEKDYFDAVTEQGETPPSAVQEYVAAANDEVIVTEPAPPEKKITLEIVNDAPVENSTNQHTVDFNSIDFETPTQAAAPITGNETPPIEKESPSLTLATTEAPPSAPPALTVAETPPVNLPPQTKKTETPASTLDLPTAPAMTPVSAETPAPKKSPGNQNQHSFDLDDIPVLQEVVAPPAGSSLTPKKPAAETKKPPPSGSDRARDIVVRAVAKLNIEMRKSGSAGMDTKTILRLQQLMRAELEKGDKGSSKN